MPPEKNQASRRVKGKSVRSIKPFSYQPRHDLATRFLKVVAVTKRSKASILHEGMEKVLPELETKFAPQLKELEKKAA